MSRRREPCRNFQRGSCQYGDRCKFLHVTQQQSKPNTFGFGSQNTSQFLNTSQQQKPNPFGFGVQNGSSSKGSPNFGARNDSSAKNTWTRNSSSTTPNFTQQASSQPQVTTHECTDPKSCKKQIDEDFKNEFPLWKLTSYGHWKYEPCDIVGDISYEELRAAAYEDAKKGLPLQAIIERERSLYKSKCAEFDNLQRNTYAKPGSSSTGTNFSPGANNTTSSMGFLNNAPAQSNSSPSIFGANKSTPSMAFQNNAPAQSTLPSVFGANNTISLMGIQNSSPPQNNTPPSFSSFSQLGASANLGFNARPLAPAATPNSFFGQSNLLQNNSKNSMNFGNSAGMFGSQLPTQPSGSSPGPNTTDFQNGFMSAGSNQVSSPFSPAQFPSSTSNQLPSSLDVLRVTSETVQQASTSDNQENSPDDSVWLKEEWAVGEIPIIAPPARFCS